MSPICMSAVLVLGALGCALFLWWLLTSGWAARLALDQPNARSLHVVPTPRCGGLGLVLITLLCAAFFLPTSAWYIFSVALLALVSWLDDRGGLPIAWRFLGHIVAAFVAVVFAPEAGWPVAALAVFAMVWGINLFNFMDGSNGMSAAMIVVGFGCYGIAAGSSDPFLASSALALSGAGAGFWIFNRTPARLFLGDVGSIPAGLAMGALGYLGWQEGIWPCWFPWLVFSPFIADASFTLLRRALRREKVWRAHREHFYQRLVQSGYTHEQTMRVWLALMLIAGALALLLKNARPEAVIAGLALYALLLALCASWVERRYQRSLLHAG